MSTQWLWVITSPQISVLLAQGQRSRSLLKSSTATAALVGVVSNTAPCCPRDKLLTETQK